MILTPKEAQKILRETKKPVFGWVKLSEHHSSRIQLHKESLCESIGDRDDSTFRYSIEESEDAVLVNC
jgi:hypothetical protein